MLKVGQILDLSDCFFEVSENNQYEPEPSVDNAYHVICDDLTDQTVVGSGANSYDRPNHVFGNRGITSEINHSEHEAALIPLRTLIRFEKSRSQSDLFIVEEENLEETMPRTSRGYPGQKGHFVLRQLTDGETYDRELPAVFINYSTDDLETRLGETLLERRFADRDRETGGDPVTIRPWVEAHHKDTKTRGYTFF